MDVEIIHTIGTKGEPQGSDSVIAKIDTVDLSPQLLNSLTMQCAKDTNSAIQYAEFTVTSDPAVVAEWGVMAEHTTCGSCIAGMNAALEALDRDPESKILIGHIFWAGPLFPEELFT